MSTTSSMLRLRRVVGMLASLGAVGTSLVNAGDVRAATVDQASTSHWCGLVEWLAAVDHPLLAATNAVANASGSCGGLRVWDLAFLGLVAIVLVAAIRFRHLAIQRRLELARRMVERGLEPPSELWGASPGGDLRRGVVLLCTGVGALVTAHASDHWSLAPLGLIPGFIGLGYLLSYRFASRRRSR
ncbi:MAG: hypothetical protein B7733_22310 [Myxococcales bacterium FL481]|nr:MAG: hypothetical protein B7733_22310 [Myxococcales bacterium FL481]